jgi:SAM-dependent methyltransferase
MTTPDANWKAFHERRKQSGRMPRWPNENMLRVLFGNDYLAHPLCLPANSRVLDVGCGFGQNLLPFAEQGFECVGVEINPKIVDVARELAEERGLAARFEVGRNGALPFPDSSFDLVLSIDTLHYESDGAAVAQALHEFARVAKPDAALYLSTIGPLHDMYVGAKKLSDGRFEVQNYDFRDGSVMFAFGTEPALGAALSKSFGIVETASATLHLMRSTLDFLIAVAQRKRT